MATTEQIIEYIKGELDSKRFAYGQPGGTDEYYARLDAKIDALDELLSDIEGMTS